MIPYMPNSTNGHTTNGHTRRSKSNSFHLNGFSNGRSSHDPYYDDGDIDDDLPGNSPTPSRSLRSPRRIRPSKSSSKKRSMCVRLRTWWSLQNDFLKAVYLVLGVFTALSMAYFTVGIIAHLNLPYPSSSSSSTLSTSSITRTLTRTTLPFFQRVRRLVKSLGRSAGWLDRRAEKLGEWKEGGPGGRLGLAPMAGTPLAQDRLGNPPAAVSPMMSWLLTKEAWERHLARQATEMKAEREATPSSSTTSLVTREDGASQWSENPWHGRSLASMTAFTIFSDLNLPTTTSSDDGMETSASSTASSSTLTLSLLVLTSWVQLLPPEKIHIFVPTREACQALVGHDGTAKNREAAINAGGSSSPNSGTSSNGASTTPVNPLAPIHCHLFPCLHPRFQRGLINCIWNDMRRYATDDLTTRKQLARKEKEDEFAKKREQLEQDGASTQRLTEFNTEAQRVLDEIEREDEVLLYLTPNTLFDVQLLTALTKLYDDSLATQALIRHLRSTSAPSTEFPHQGLDASGGWIPDSGDFFVLGKRTDVAMRQEIVRKLQPPVSEIDSSSSSSLLFHAPTSAFNTLIQDALETLWKASYTKAQGGGVLHSGYGMDYMALRLDTFNKIQETYLQRKRKEQEEMMADVDSPEMMADRRSSSATGSDDRSALLAAASVLPASSSTLFTTSSTTFTSPLTSSESWFPPFLIGLFRWENWLVSEMILSEDLPMKVKVIDASGSVTVVHVEMKTTTMLTTKSSSSSEASDAQLTIEGAKYNEALVQALTDHNYRIGSIDFAPFQMVGSCVLERIRPTLVKKGSNSYTSNGLASDSNPEDMPMSPTLLPPVCLVQPRSPGNFSNLYWFTKQASRPPALSSNYLIILTVNSGYLKLALNWLCWARRIEFTNYILLAEDQASARIFRALGAPVIVPSDAAEDLPPSDYGSVEFQRTMSFRTEFLMEVLLAGFHFVTADMDAIWFDNPIPSFDVLADLSGQTHKGYKLSGGFIVVRSTPYGRYFWSRVIECQRLNAEYLATHAEGTYEPSQFTEQYCINELSLGLERKKTTPPFVRTLLDPYGFPDGKSFFDQRNSQHRGVWPVVIHNNWIMGVDGKFNRMLDWKMVSISSPSPNDLEKRDGMDKAITDGKKLKEWGIAVWMKKGMLELDVCTEEPIVKREPIPLPSASSSNALTGSTTSSPQHPFHMHIRVFLSDSAADGVETSDEFDALKRCIASIIETDFSGIQDSQGRPVKVHIYLELMLDHLLTSDTNPSLTAAAAAEFDRLRYVLKSLKQQFTDKFGTPETNGYAYLFEIKRPKPTPGTAMNLGTGAPAQPQNKRIGKLGLWTIPWLKHPSTVEAIEAQTATITLDLTQINGETPQTAHGGFHSEAATPAVHSGVSSSSSSSTSSSSSDEHHDVALYLQDTVTLSPTWLQVAYKALEEYYITEPSVEASSSTSSTSKSIDPRIYGISLLDVHEIYGENTDHTYQPGPEYVQRRFDDLSYFNSSANTWRRVKQQAMELAVKASGGSSLSSKSADTSTFQSYLPLSYFDHKVFGYQYLTSPDAIILFPQHFNNFVTWLSQQNIVDTESSEAAPRPPSAISTGVTASAKASKCIPTLYSNKLIASQPPATTWYQWLNRWSYERGFYPLHHHLRRMDIYADGLISSFSGVKEIQIRQSQQRYALAMTEEQRLGKRVKPIEKTAENDAIEAKKLEEERARRKAEKEKKKAAEEAAKKAAKEAAGEKEGKKEKEDKAKSKEKTKEKDGKAKEKK